MGSAIFVVLLSGVLAGPASTSTHELLGQSNVAILAHSMPTLSTSDERLRTAILQAAKAASTSESLLRIEVNYPLDEAVFPPDMAAQTFVWSDAAAQANTWLIDMAWGEDRNHLYVLTQGAAPPPPRDSDPNTVSKEAAAFKPPTPEVPVRRWMPIPDTWDQIKNLWRSQAVTVTISGFHSSRPTQSLSRLLQTHYVGRSGWGTDLLSRRTLAVFARPIKS
jgi:hypothetical protein